MSISLPVELEAIAEELNYEHGRLIYEGVGGNEVRRSILPGGVRVITEKMPGTRGVSIGFWVGVGSRDEAPGMLGSTQNPMDTPRVPGIFSVITRTPPGRMERRTSLPPTPS